MFDEARADYTSAMASSGPSITDWLNVWFSAGAVFISLASIFIAGLGFRRDRAHLKVHTDLSRFGYADGSWSEEMLAITIRNDGRYDEVVTGVGLRGGKRKVALALQAPTPANPTKRIPWRLAPGDSESAHSPIANLRHPIHKEFGGKRYRAYADCASGRTYDAPLSRKLRAHLRKADG